MMKVISSFATTAKRLQRLAVFVIYPLALLSLSPPPRRCLHDPAHGRVLEFVPSFSFGVVAQPNTVCSQLPVGTAVMDYCKNDGLCKLQALPAGSAVDFKIVCDCEGDSDNFYMGPDCTTAVGRTYSSASKLRNTCWLEDMVGYYNDWKNKLPRFCCDLNGNYVYSTK